MFYAIAGGLVMVLFIFYFFVVEPQDKMAFSFQFDYVYIIGVLISFGTVFLGHFLKERRIRSVSHSTSHETKMDTLKSALIMNWAFLECAGMINAILWYINGNALFLILSMIMIIVLILNRPVFEG